jgi:hypothetical protein
VPAIFPPGHFAFSRQAHTIDYHCSLSLVNMPPKLLTATMGKKDADVAATMTFMKL